MYILFIILGVAVMRMVIRKWMLLDRQVLKKLFIAVVMRFIIRVGSSASHIPFVFKCSGYLPLKV